ncbi:hypothetical protein ACWDNI_35880 [Nocardia niigatensis]
MMASNRNLKINKKGLHELRSAPGVQAELKRRGQAVLEECGGEAAGYMLSSFQGKKKPQGRWHVNIFTATPRAMVDNMKNNTLVRAFGAARRG